MKKISFFIVLLLFLSNISGQNFSDNFQFTKLNEDLPEDKVPVGFIDNKDETFSVFFNKDKEIYQEKFNSDLTKISSKKIEGLSEMGYINHHHGIKRVNDKYYALLIDGREYYLMPIDSKTGKIGEKVHTYKTNRRIDDQYKLEVNFVSSPNNKSVAVITPPHKFKTNKNLIYNVYSVDQSNKIEHWEVEIPGNIQFTTVKEFQIDDKGNVYAFCQADYSKSKYAPFVKASKLEHEYQIMAFSHKSSKPKVIKLKNSSSFNKTMTFNINKNNELSAFGLNADKETKDIKGVSYYKIYDGKVQNSSHQKFSKKDIEIINEQNSRNKINEKTTQKLFENYELKEIIFKPDGSSIAVAEFIKHDSNPNTSVVTIYHKYLLLVSTDKTGEIQKISHIKKNQKSYGESSLLSYAKVFFNESICFLFNSHKNDLDKNYDDTPEEVKACTDGITINKAVIYRNI